MECDPIFLGNLDITEKEILKLEAFNMWPSRNMVKIRLTEEKSYEEVIQMVMNKDC